MWAKTHLSFRCKYALERALPALGRLFISPFIHALAKDRAEKFCLSESQTDHELSKKFDYLTYVVSGKTTSKVMLSSE